MELLNSSFKKNDNIAWRIIDGEAFLVNPKDSLIYPLNSVATRIWELLDGEKTTKEIVDTIQKEFKKDKAIIEKDALSFLEKLLKADLARGTDTS